MKDFKGRKCSSRHFRRGNNLIPVLIPLEWKNDWHKLNKECWKSGTTDVPEDQYWQWREEQERSHTVVESIKSFTHSLKNRFKKLF